MTGEHRPMEQLGRRIGDDLGSGTSRDRLDRHEQAFSALVAAGIPDRRRRRIGWAVAAAAVVLLAGLGTWFAWPTPRPLAYTFEATRFEGGQPTWLDVPADREGRLQFDGGSEFVLAAGADARVAETDRDKVHIELAAGQVSADVRGNGVTRWAIDVGSWRVTVLGTMFTVAWDPEQAALDVWVDEGIVRVEGEGLSGPGVEVSAGQHLRADARLGRVALQSTAPAIPRPVGARDERSLEPSQDVPLYSTPAETPPAESPVVYVEADVVETVPPVGGDELALRTEDANDRAVSFPPLPLPPQRGEPPAPGAAREPSVNEVLDHGDADQLWQLADTARLDGDTDLASRALARVRENHPGAERAHRAAYLLGRMAQEVQADPAAASRWYEAYLAESPGGPLAEEALGRLILAHDAAGDPDRAREVAQAYLERYPDGSFAAMAGTIGEP